MKKTTATGLLLLAMFLIWPGIAVAAETASQCELCHSDTVTKFTAQPAIYWNNCVRCHSSPRLAGCVPPPYNYIAYNGSGAYYKNITSSTELEQIISNYREFHRLHAGRGVSTTNPGCKQCHGDGWYTVDGSGNVVLSYTGGWADGRMACEVCHNVNYHPSHGLTAYDTKVTAYAATGYSYTTATGGKYPDMRCISPLCHGNPDWTRPAGTVIGNTSTAENVWSLVVRADGKKLCVNCHNSARNGYEIDYVTGHGTDTGIFHRLSVYATQPTDSVMGCSKCHFYETNGVRQEAGTDIAAFHNSLGVVGNSDFVDRNCTTCHSPTASAFTPRYDDYSWRRVHDVVKDSDRNADESNRRCEACHTQHPTTEQGIRDWYMHRPPYSNFARLLWGGYDYSGSEYICAKCHSDNLLTEHKQDSVPEDKRCTLCHDTTNEQVKSAVAKVYVYCRSCHTDLHSRWQANHESTKYPQLPAFSRNETCYTSWCHNQNVIGDHYGDCDKCHSNPVYENTIRQAAQTGDTTLLLSCASCHDMGRVHLDDEKTSSLHAADDEYAYDYYLWWSEYRDGKLVRLYYDGQTGEWKTLDLNCDRCHEKKLHKEHLGYPGLNGTPMNCDTCHDPQSYKPITEWDSTRIDTASEPFDPTWFWGKSGCYRCHVKIHTVAYSGQDWTDLDKIKQIMAVADDPSGLHTGNFVANMFVDCSSCHDRALDREHAKYGLNCLTCHKNKDPRKYLAIRKGQTNCDACHSSIHQDVSSYHEVNFSLSPLNCSICHSSNLTTEHGSRGLNCVTCHSSIDQDVRRAIASGNTTCNSCHGELHPDYREKHRKEFPVGTRLNCANCHQDNLLVEHAGIACSRCHNAPVWKTVEMKGGKVGCSDCHGPIHADVSGKHRVGFGGYSLQCGTCHQGMLDMEHSRHGIGCDSCHKSGKQEIRAAVANKRKDCRACHGSIHGMAEVSIAHGANFISNPRFDCSGCHSNNLVTEHTNRSLDCNTCHSRPVRSAKDCGSCHIVHRDVNEAHWKQYWSKPGTRCTDCHRIHE